MLRIGRHLKRGCKNYRQSASRYQNARGFSMSASGGGAGKTLLIAGGTVVAGGAAAVAVASQKPEIRRTIENYIPSSQYLFDPILGPLSEEDNRSQSIKSKADPFESSLRKVKKPVKKKEKEIENENKSVQEPKQEEIVEAVQSVQDIEEIEQSSDGAQEEFQTGESQTPSELPPVPLDPPSEESSVNVEEESTDPSSAQNISKSVEQEETAETAPQDSSEPESSTYLERTAEEVKESLVKLAEDVTADAAATSRIVTDALTVCAQKCVTAIESSSEAVKAISLHTQLLKNAMDENLGSAEDKQTQWSDLSTVLEQKSRLQTEADAFYQDAKQELTKLKSIIEQAKKTKSEEVNHKIIEAEENYTEMLKDVEDLRTEVNTKLAESHVMSQYKDLIETAKDQFRNELLSILPDVKLESGWRSLNQKLTHDDLNALIAHAHRRVDQLQRELAEERAISTRRMEMAVRAARERWNEEKGGEVTSKLEQLKDMLDFEHDKKMQEARITFESEMLVQLKRQAAAHSQHLTEMLSLQEKQLRVELESDFQKRLADQEFEFTAKMQEIKSNYENDLHELTDKFHFDLNKALARVNGIETAVDGRAHIESESRKAQELWLSCEALRIALQYGDDGKPLPLRSEIDSIVHIPGAGSVFHDVAKTLPDEAALRGVYTEESLRVAYKQVSKMCRRLSLINNTSNSLFMYFLSYLKSFLIISRAQNEPPSDLKLDELDTFQILSYATYSLEHGELELATRFLNQLEGEPKRIAEGWLKEARLLLETRQTVQALSSLASALTIAANMEG